jgi:hypothetical protein
MAKDNDLVSALIYEESTGSAVVLHELTTRSEGTLSTTLTSLFSGKTVHCWIAVKSADSKLIATSTYLGEVTVR